MKHPTQQPAGRHTRPTRPTALAALAGVAAAAVVLSVAELIGAFFTARATPVIALGSTFIDFTPPWMKDFAIATFGTNDKAALFVGMGVTILVLAFGLMLVMEGALYALFPGPMKRLMTQAIAQPEGALRLAGLALAIAGFALVWAVRH